ncbi:MAG: sterol desaturase family protein [Myxococcota bacterium]
MTSFYAVIFAVFAVDTALLVGLAWAYHSPRFADARISTKVKTRIAPRARLVKILSSSAISLLVVLGATYVLFDHLFVATSVGVGRILLEAAAILVIYDFAYYFFHRAMHHKRLMKPVHGVHHRARNPSALESFYLHPLELLGGLALLLGATALVGPVHVYAFGTAFFFYSTLNIIIHAGLRMRHPLLRPLDYLIRKHHIHHMGDFRKNYSSLTPLPDLIFRTAE